MQERGRGAALAAGLLVALAGCAAGVDDEGARSVAAAFADPAADPRSRCELLAGGTRSTLEEDEETSCAAALPDLPVGEGAVESVVVWGDEAQARLTDDVLFLTRTRDGWRVVAGACRPGPADAPYDCRLEGS